MSERRQIIAGRTPGVRRAGLLALAVALAGWHGCTSTPPSRSAGNSSPAAGADASMSPPDAAARPLSEQHEAFSRAQSAQGESVAAVAGATEEATVLELTQRYRSYLNATSSSLQSRNLVVDTTDELTQLGAETKSPKVLSDPANAPATRSAGPRASGEPPDLRTAVPGRSPTPEHRLEQPPPAPTASPAPKDAAAPDKSDLSDAEAKKAEALRSVKEPEVARPGGPGVGRPTAAAGTAEARRDRLEVPLRVGEDDKSLDKLAVESGADRSRLERPLARFDEELWVISRPAPRAAVAESRRPPDAGAGTLWLGRGVGGRTATLREYKAEAVITGPVSSVTVSQRFENELSETVDGVYVLPMPRDAAVTDFVMTVGAPGRERRIRGVIRERAEAERIFLDAQRQGKTASLLDEEVANVLVQRVGNIASGASISTSVTYFATLDYAGISTGQGAEVAGAYEFVLPMAGLSPADAGVPVSAPASVAVSVSVRIEAGLEVLGVLSPTHAVRVEQTSETGRVVTMGSPLIASARDFVLRYAVAAPTPRVGVISQCGAGGTFFSMVVTPPAQTGERVPLDVVVIADLPAGSVPEHVRSVKAAATRLLGKLGPSDRFVIASSGFSSEAMTNATPEAISAAVERLNSGSPDAGRPLGLLLREALAHGREGSRVVCVIGRGEISDGVQSLREARAGLRSSRIFAISIDEPAGFALESLSRIGRGGVVHLSSDPAASAGDDAILARLFEREGSPIMTDLEIDWGGAEVTDVFPRRLPDLSAGRPVHIVGRLLSPPPAGRAIRVTGTVRGLSGVRRETLTAGWSAATPAPGAIPTLWARAKVLMLAEHLAGGPGDAESIRRELVDLALRHNLVSAMTSFISVDAISSVSPTITPVPRVDQAANAPPR